MKFEIKNESYNLFYGEEVQIAQKIRLSIIFSSVVQMEWIKSFHVDKSSF